MNNAYFLFVPLFVLALVLEATVTTLPLVLIVLILFTGLTRFTTSYFFAIFLGIFLDMYGLRLIGVTSLFFVIVVFLVLRYGRKLATNRRRFLTVITFLASLVFVVLFGFRPFILQAICSLALVILFYFVLKPVLIRVS